MNLRITWWPAQPVTWFLVRGAHGCFLARERCTCGERDGRRRRVRSDGYKWHRTKRKLAIPVERGGRVWLGNGTNNYGANDLFLFFRGLTVDRIWRKTELLWPKVNVRVRHITRVMCCPFCPTWDPRDYFEG